MGRSIFPPGSNKRHSDPTRSLHSVTMIIAKKMILKTINVLCLVVSFAAAASFQDPDVDVNSYNSVNLTADDALKEIMGKECRSGYSLVCLKLGLMRLIGRGGGFTIPIVPGVRLTSLELPQGPLTSPSELAKEPELLDSLLLKHLTDYLVSLSISVNILDKSMPLHFAKAYFGNNPTTGRKNKNGGALAAAGLMSVGTMLAVGMAALAAMAGKALMASLLALMLAAVASLSKGGGEEGKTTYEIVAKPIVSHQHSHSSEVIHGGHHHRRSIDEPESMIYAKQIPYQKMS